MHLESYDLFDTLITRSTKTPRGVFQLIGLSKLVVFRCILFRFIPFHVWRRHAEHIARRLSHQEDICITDIYRVLGWIIKNPAKIMRQEISLEKAIIQPIPSMISQLKQQHDKGVKCCIVSDMYLHRFTINEIVNRHIIDIPIYLSSERGITKSTGNLFIYLSKDQNIDIHNIHHQGDNNVADYEIPLRLGLKATLVEKPRDESSCSSLDVFKCSDEDPFYNMGFRVAGPAAFSMAKGLDDYISKKEPENIVFAARDMHLVLDAFNKISEFKKTSYLRISRSAVYHAQWYASKNPEKWFEGVANGSAFFSRLGLECPTELALLNPYIHSKRFLKELEHNGFMHSCMNEYKIIRQYLLDQGIKKGTLFVDLGWRGSIQDAISQILSPEFKINGWYFGTIHNKLPDQKHGFYFNKSKPLKRTHKILQSISFFEFIFTESIASLSKIEISQDRFIPVFLKDESPEQILAREKITKGATDYINMMASLDKLVKFDNQKLINALDDLFKEYLLNPPNTWVEALESMTHSGGFGGSGKAPMIGDSSGKFLGFLKSTWKGAYIKKNEKSSSIFLMKIAHNYLFFGLYELMKVFVRYLRKMIIHKPIKVKQNT